MIWISSAVALLFGAVIAVGLLHKSTGLATDGPIMSQLDALHVRCVQDMVANTCKVMGAAAIAANNPSAKTGELVFIAGVGAIAASDYQKMYEAGEAMCSVVRAKCAREWDGRQCITARKLWQPKQNQP